jgi:hypothetical protein
VGVVYRNKRRITHDPHLPFFVEYEVPALVSLRTITRQQQKLSENLGVDSTDRGTTLNPTPIVERIETNGWRNPDGIVMVQVFGDAFRAYKNESFTNICVRGLSPLDEEASETTVTSCRHM